MHSTKKIVKIPLAPLAVLPDDYCEFLEKHP